MWLAIIGTVILFVVLVGLVYFNRVIKSRNKIDEAWSEIDIQLNRRRDIIPKILETVRLYSEQEADLMEQIMATRVRSMTEDGHQDLSQIESMLSGQLRALFASIGKNPQITSDRGFIDLARNLASTEDQIQNARKKYNDIVRSYNSLIQSFPSRLFAEQIGYHREAYFEMEYATPRRNPDSRSA